MSEYSDFCKSFGGSPNDPSFMDRFLSGNSFVHDEESNPYYGLVSQENTLKFKNEYKLSDEQWYQVLEYLYIFRENSFTRHYQVNEYITENEMWNMFPSMRSKNHHANGTMVLGITEKYFKLICELLQIRDCNGSPLIKSERY